MIQEQNKKVNETLRELTESRIMNKLLRNGGIRFPTKVAANWFIAKLKNTRSYQKTCFTIKYSHPFSKQPYTVERMIFVRDE